MPPNYVHQAMGIMVPKCVRKPLSYDSDYVRGILTTIFLQDLDRQGASANLKAAMVSGMHDFLKQTEQADDKIQVIPGYVKDVSRSEKSSKKDNSYIGSKNLIIFTHDGMEAGKNEIISTDWVDTTFTHTSLGTMEFEVALANTISALAQASRDASSQVWVRKFQQAHESDDPKMKVKNHRWAIDISVEFDEDEFFAAGSVTMDENSADSSAPDYAADADNYEAPEDPDSEAIAEMAGEQGEESPELDPIALQLRDAISLENLLYEVDLDGLFWIISDHLATLSEEQWEYARGMVEFLAASEKTNDTVTQASDAIQNIFTDDKDSEHVEAAIAGSYFDGSVLQYFAHVYADTCLASAAAAE